MAAGQLTRAVQRIRRLLGAPGGGDLTDRELLERFAAGNDHEAFATLVHRHGQMVFGVCRRILDNDADADDAFQATLLVLARKARSVQWHESIGNWLYAVAYRTASRARARDRIRRRHQQQASAMHPTESPSDVDWQQLRLLLDDELMHLPVKYRLPLLLCYLHGKTRDEAAEELGWTVGTVKGCLERGRELLRSRLERRGLTLSVALLPTLLAEGVVSAVPPSLLTTTVDAIASGTVSAPVAALTKGVVQAMAWANAKAVTAVLLTAGVIGSAFSYWNWSAVSRTSSASGPSAREAGRTHDALEIPLKDIWAVNMPGTKHMNSTWVGGKEGGYPLPDGELAARILNILCNTANAPLEGFAVPGQDLDALKEAHRVFDADFLQRLNNNAPNATLSQRETTFRQPQRISLVFSLYVAAGQVHIDKVIRAGSTFTIHYRIVPGSRLTLWDNVQFGLIALPPLLAGEYRVETRGAIAPRSAETLDQVSRRQWEEHMAARVCRPFTFTVAVDRAEDGGQLVGLTVAEAVRRIGLKPEACFITDEPPGVGRIVEGKTANGETVRLWVSRLDGVFSEERDWTFAQFAQKLVTSVETDAVKPNQAVLEAMKKIAVALEKDDNAGAQRLAQQLAKTIPDLAEVMGLFHYRTKPNGEPFKGIGVGPRPGAIRPDGIEKKLTDLAENPLSAQQFAAEADALKDAGYVAAAIAEVTLAKGPPREDAAARKIAATNGKEWIEWAQELKRDGAALAAAAKDKKVDALRQLGSKFSQFNESSSCNKCHEGFNKW